MTELFDGWVGSRFIPTKLVILTGGSYGESFLPLKRPAFQIGNSAQRVSEAGFESIQRTCAMESLAYCLITDENAQIEQRAHAIVNAHPHFRQRAEQFKFVCQDGVLVVHGFVPSFYLKQVLQIAIQRLDGVRGIDNQVQVTTSAGLSCDGIHKSAK